MSYAQVEPYKGERGQRGIALPKGYQNVSDLMVKSTKKSEPPPDNTQPADDLIQPEK